MKARDERDKLLPPVREVELRPAEETIQAIQPVLVPETPEEEPEIIYAPILSGVGSNKLALISTRIKPDIDTEAETATYMQSGLSLIIGDYGSITEGFRVSTQKLYDMLVLKLTNQNHYGDLTGNLNRRVTIHLDDILSARGAPLTEASRKRIRKICREDLATLYNASLEFEEKEWGGKKYEKAEYSMRIIEDKGISNSYITVELTQKYAEYLMLAYVGQYPLRLQRTDDRFPLAYHLGRKLMQHYSIEANHANGTANLISIKAVMSSIQDIPSFEEVKASGRQYTARIIKPISKALEHLCVEKVCVLSSWYFCNAKGKALTKTQQERGDYDTLSNCYIHFTPLLDAELRKVMQANITKRTEARKAKALEDKSKRGKKAGKAK